MFLDASAMVAMMTNETDALALAGRMQKAKNRSTSPIAIWETAINVARILALPIDEATSAVRDFIEVMNIQILAVPPKAGFIAIDAFDRFGKGRHPAGLNFGDCMAYACARYYRQALLFKGEDFPRTDIEPA